MYKSFKSIEEYYDTVHIEFGRQRPEELLAKMDDIREEASVTLEGDTSKRHGHNDMNSFAKVPKSTADMMSEFWNKRFGVKYSWGWEYMNSCEPVGLHNDYTASKVDGGKDYVVVGIIIPLDFKCGRDALWHEKLGLIGKENIYTVFYDRFENEPRKVMFSKGEMRYKDTGEVIDYRKTEMYDWHSLRYNPPETQYFKQFSDLRVSYAHQWVNYSPLIFDTRQWHSSSWYLKGNRVDDNAGEFKRSIIGFAAVRIEE